MKEDTTMDPSKHISEIIRQNEILRVMKPRHMMWAPEQIVWDQLQHIDLLRVSQVCNVETNWAMTSALVERWRPETPTFHFSIGECTVTLEDVVILMGLHVRGYPVIGTTNSDRNAISISCQELLGVVPQAVDVRVGEISITWLTRILNSN